MAFPVVQTTSVGFSTATSHSVPFPTGIVSGDLIWAFISGGTSYPTVPTGFSGWGSYTDVPGWSAYTKMATGGEGANFTFTTPTSVTIAYIILRISGARMWPILRDNQSGYDMAPLWSGLFYATTVDPPEDVLWLSMENHNSNIVASATGNGYTGLLTASGTGIGAAISRKNEAVAYQNTFSFTLPSNVDWNCFGTAILPAFTNPVISSVAESYGWGVSAVLDDMEFSSYGWGVSASIHAAIPVSISQSYGWGVTVELSQGEVGKSHHLKLGNEYLMVRSNTYQKKRAPTFGARITTGDPDYNNLSIWQHWVQKCWVGGMGSIRWIDPEMFDDAVGIDTTVHEEFRLSRSLGRGTGTDWDMRVGGVADAGGYQFEVFNGVLYCLTLMSGTVASRLYSYNPTTQSWTLVAMPGVAMKASCMTSFAGKLFMGGTDNGIAALFYATVPGTWSKQANPVDVGSRVSGLKAFNQRLYVVYETRVWRLKDTLEWDGNVVFYVANANSGSNYIAAMETHLGYLYMLSQNGHLHRTDGNNTFDIWSWDSQTAGVSLKSYDNKLFVGTYEYTDTPDLGFGVLYQFTGAAVTELKRWGKVGKATSIGKMTVYGRRLYYGASSLFGEADGFGVAMYDSVNDGHSIFAVSTDLTPSYAYPDTSGVGTAWLVDDVYVFGGKLFAAVRGHGVFMTQDTFRDSLNGLAQYHMAGVGGKIDSSLYDAGTPGLEKLWQKVTVYASIPLDTSMRVSYSLDDGLNWIPFDTVVGPQSDTQFIFRLRNIRGTQFKWRINLWTTSLYRSPVVKGVVVAYLPQPEPNWLWTFTIPVSDKWQLLDGTEEVKDTETLIAYFERLFRNQEVIHFIDIDGIEWATVGPGVLIYDMTTTHFDISDPREADLRMSILEVVESYA